MVQALIFLSSFIFFIIVMKKNLEVCILIESKAILCKMPNRAFIPTKETFKTFPELFACFKHVKYEFNLL